MIERIRGFLRRELVVELEFYRPERLRHLFNFAVSVQNGRRAISRGGENTLHVDIELFGFSVASTFSLAR